MNTKKEQDTTQSQLRLLNRYLEPQAISSIYVFHLGFVCAVVKILKMVFIMEKI